MSDQPDNPPDDSPGQPAGAPAGDQPGAPDAPAGFDGFDLGGMLEQVQALQSQMIEAQEQQEARVVVGSSGGGKVTVEVTGGGEFRNVTISPEVVDADDVEMLEDLVLAALRDAMSQIHEGQAQAVGGLQLPDLGGLDDLGGLGGLGGLLGGR